MNIKRIPIEKIELNTGQIEGLPANPRQWTRDDIDRIAASLKETPELFEMRPCIVYPLEGGGKIRTPGRQPALLRCTSERDERRTLLRSAA